MNLIGVDLAAKYSAAVWTDHWLPVIGQFDSTDRTETQFLQGLTAPFEGPDLPAQLVVEDLPHGVAYRNLVKRVCQLQGRIAERMDGLGCLDLLLFVAPATWRNAYPVLRKRGQGMDAVVPIACEYGYVPPDIPALRGPRGGNALERKVQTDYCAAYLIARWAIETHTTHGTFDVPGTNRYARSTLRKDTPRAEEVH